MKFTFHNNTKGLISIPNGPGGAPVSCLPSRDTTVDFAGDTLGAEKFRKQLATATVRHQIDSGALRMFESKGSSAKSSADEPSQGDLLSGTSGKGKK